MNLTKRKKFLGPIDFDNIDIIQDWIVEKENFLDKNDFDMHWKAIEESLITYSKIINDENNEIIILRNENQCE